MHVIFSFILLSNTLDINTNIQHCTSETSPYKNKSIKTIKLQTLFSYAKKLFILNQEKQIELNSSEPRLILLGLTHTTTPLLWRKLLDRSTPYSCFLEYFGRFSIERSSWSIQPSPLHQHTGIRAARADHNTKAHCTM